MRKMLTALPMLILVSTVSHSLSDHCQKLPGDWNGHGVFTDFKLCKKYHTCKFKLSAHVSKGSSTQFKVDYHPTKGPSGTYIIQCKNGNISSDASPNGKFKYWCNGNNCLGEYKDSKQMVYFQNF